MKLSVFSFIDEVISYKRELRFEIDATKKALDRLFSSIFSEHESFINYTSRIKEDGSLKEKIIRQNYAKKFDTPSLMFDYISDIIGCRVECRFISDEPVLFEELFRHFPKRKSDGYYQSDRDPRVELKLGEPQPMMQKNGFPSYRIDGHFLGDRVLNFELQIKSIVNVFWNEIDHKILYKNYNYLVTEKFAREIMASIKGDLTLIDREMEMVYEHLQTLDSPASVSTNQQLRGLLGRVLQDAYIGPLREHYGWTFDFRASIDLITEFAFERVRYEPRESMASEFVRMMDIATKSQSEALHFGETIHFAHPIYYHNDRTETLGLALEQAMNEDLLWNLLVHMLMQLYPHIAFEELFRTFVDYLYFQVVRCIRKTLSAHTDDAQEIDEQLERLAGEYVQHFSQDLLAKNFTGEGMHRLREQLSSFLEERADEYPSLALRTEAYVHLFFTSKEKNRDRRQALCCLHKDKNILSEGDSVFMKGETR